MTGWPESAQLLAKAMAAEATRQGSGPQLAPAPDGSRDGFTPAELVKMAGDLVNKGVLTKQQAEAMLRDEGVADPAKVAAEASSTPMDGPAARPQDFVMPKYSEDGKSTPETQAFDTTARGWLTDVGFPKGVGEAVAAEANKCAENWVKLDASGRVLALNESKAALQRLFGNQYETKIAMARELVAKIDQGRPGLIQSLRLSGAGNSPFVITQIIHAAERAAAKRGGK